MKGKVVLNVSPSFGLVKIGAHGLGTQDVKYSRTMWEMDGSFVVNGHASIGRGSRISVGHNGILNIGDDFVITGRSCIICQKNISFGDKCLLSWDILIMDTDFHNIKNSNGEVINSPCPIKIGNHVWIGCRNTILKGVEISDNVVVSANSLLTKNVEESNCIVGGSGKNMNILKRGITWEI